VVSRLEHVFEPDCRAHQEIAVDETKIEIDGTEHYVWAAVDREMLEIHTIGIFSDRSGLDALLFLKDALDRCCGLPLVRVDRGW
jgi:transposase-like protein